jgi:hypothetical protein
MSSTPRQQQTITFLCHLCHKVSTVSSDINQSHPTNDEEMTSNASPETWKFALPLRLSSTSSSSASQKQDTYRVPAMQCPLLWYLILDGSTTSPEYWAHIRNLLSATFAQIPQHVHVAIMVIYPRRQVAVWQANGTVPHLYRYPPGTDGMETVLALSVRPMIDGQYFEAISAACPQASPPLRDGPSSSDATSTPSWKWLVTRLAEGLKAIGQPAGQRSGGLSHTKLSYAGAHITCLRASFPSKADDPRQLLQPELCAAAAVTIQSMGVLDTHSETMKDPPYPLMTALEESTLIWYTGRDLEDVAKFTENAAWWPWKRAYGAQLRLRCSPGLIIDDGDGVEDGDTALWLQKEGGLTGPAVLAPQASDLWMIPSLDVHTTFVLDLALDDDDTLSPTVAAPQNAVLQMCLAYTAFETDEDGQAWTVRRMQLAHQTFHRVATVEALYRRVDPEALAVVLLQKITRYDPPSRLAVGEEWLRDFLVAVYKSAQEEERRQAELQKHGIADDEEGYFMPSHRLLSRRDESFSSSATDILLAQGHGRLQPIALLVYLILQRLITEGTSFRSDRLHSHGLSLRDLVTMSPESLSRCLAPRLQLWSNDEVIVDLIDLAFYSIQSAIREEAAMLMNPWQDLLLVVDSPEEIIVDNAKDILKTKIQQHGQQNASKPGANLQKTLNEMANSYQTPPPIHIGMNDKELVAAKCKEDLPILFDSSGNVHSPNFRAWRQMIAEQVEQQLQNCGRL